MSDTTTATTRPDPFDPATRPELYDGILAKRVVAFCVDAVVVGLLMIPAGILFLMLGLVTLGLAWILLPPLFVIVALAYYAFTLGGAKSATIGMQLVGIELRAMSGARMFPLMAMMHALIFWFSVSVVTPLVLLVGLFGARSRLLHDIILNTVMLNSRFLRPGE